MPDELCPVCGEPYVDKKEFTTAIRYCHTPPKPNCDLQIGLPVNPNKAESTPPSVLRRQMALKSKRGRR
jgi:hypothetical protein